MSQFVQHGYLEEHPSVCSADCDGFLQLLQLPETALDLVLQQLDPCSLVSAASACRGLRDHISERISKVDVRCTSQALLDSFILWLEGHSSSPNRLTQCSVDGAGAYPSLALTILPCPQLQQLQLQLKDLSVQLGPAAGSLGVLHGCTGLRVLDLEGCQLLSTHAALAAIAALPQLQHLHFTPDDFDDMKVFPQFQHPLQLTHLSITRSLCLRACTSCQRWSTCSTWTCLMSPAQATQVAGPLSFRSSHAFTLIMWSCTRHPTGVMPRSSFSTSAVSQHCSNWQ
jgi:hypothetical protein